MQDILTNKVPKSTFSDTAKPLESSHLAKVIIYTVSQRGYHPITNDNFNNSCRIPIIFGTNITE